MKKLLLPAIIILAAVTRLFGLGTLPAGFTPDEASFGYDAYSLLMTGRDQWGSQFPLTFLSFGDGKLPLYGYITIPFVYIFGLEEYAIRLPNALFGVGSVIVTFILTKKLFKEKTIWYLSSLFVALSPWHIPMSRGGFEANLTTLLLPLTILLFLIGIKKPFALVFCAIIFVLNIFSYHSARLVSPLLLFAMIFLYRRELSRNYWSLIALSIAGIGGLVAVYTMLGIGGTRLASAGIFSAISAADARFEAVLLGLPEPVSRLFNNKLTAFVSVFSKQYIQYFSPEFLFTKGPAEYTYGMVPGVGVLYPIQILSVIGLFIALITKKIKRAQLVLILWILLAPIPAALSVGPGYAANRAVIMIPALSILLAWGLYTLFERIRIKKTYSYLTFLIVLFGSFAFFLEDYIYHQPIGGSRAMIHGVKEALLYTESYSAEEKEILISKSISEPHIFVAFYNNVSPELYQSTSGNWGFSLSEYKWVDQIPSYSLVNYTFEPIDLAKLRTQEVIAVGTPEDFMFDDSQVIHKVLYPEGVEAYWIVEYTRDE